MTTRRMLQPTKNTLRETLNAAHAEIKRLKGEVDSLAARLEGEARAFGGGILVGIFATCLSWWLA